MITCRKCRRGYDAGREPDPCIGELPGVLEACCGHGKPRQAYVTFENGIVLRGFDVQIGTGRYRPPAPDGT